MTVNKQIKEELLLKLKNGDGQIRKSAALALADIGDVDVIPALKEAYENTLDQDKDVYVAIAIALAELGSFGILWSDLNTESGYSRRSTTSKLCELPDDHALNGLLRALKEGDATVRFWVADALGSLEDKRAVAPLIVALKDDSVNVRSKAIASLRSLGDPRALPALEWVVQNDTGINSWKIPVSKEAAKAIEHIKHPEVELLKTVKAISDLKDPAESLISLLANVRYAPVRAEIIIALGKSRDQKAIKPLIRVLDNNDREIQKLAILALADLGDPDVIPSLKEAYNNTPDQDKDVYVAIAIALAELGSFGILWSDLNTESGHSRVSTIRALRELPDDHALNGLLRALKEGDDNVKFWVADALGGLDDKRAVEPLIDALKTDYVDLRSKAIASLRSLGDPRALPALEWVVRNDTAKNWWKIPISEEAAKAIEHIKHPEIEMLKTVKAISDLKDPAESLISLLANVRYAPVHAEIIIALGKSRDQTAIKPLIRVLDNNDREIQKLAILALANIGDTSVIPSLKEAYERTVDVDDLKMTLMIALAELGDFEFFVRALTAENGEINEDAVAFLGTLPDDHTRNGLLKAQKEGDETIKTCATAVLALLNYEAIVVPLTDPLQANNALEISSPSGTAKSASESAGNLEIAQKGTTPNNLEGNEEGQSIGETLKQIIKWIVR